MASKTNRKKRRKARRPDTPADQPGAGEAKRGEGSVARSGETDRKPKSRLAAAMDRMEQTIDERPPAPWGNFPLGPLSILAGLVLIVIGVINTDPVLMTMGVGIGAVGGLELSIREHFTGFRSHTTLLAGVVFVATVWICFYAVQLVLWACLLIGAAIAVPALLLLRKRFEKASGGLSYKIR